MSERQKSAAELMAELRLDAAFRQRDVEAKQNRQLREQEYSRLLAPIVSKLHELGMSGGSLQEIVLGFAPISGDAVEILLEGLVELNDARAKETVIRALGAARAPFDGRSLTRCFARTADEGLKWAILNTIALTRPHSIDDWLLSIEGTLAGETLRKLGA